MTTPIIKPKSKPKPKPIPSVSPVPSPPPSPQPASSNSSPRHSPRSSRAKPSNKYMINLDDFELTGESISGSYGEINYIVKKTNKKKKYVSKTCLFIDDQNQHFFRREILILIHVQHPTIVRFFGFSFSDFNGNSNNLTFVMEFAEKGSLADLLKAKNVQDLDNTKRQIILIGIARAMMLLHKRHIFHRDLKPENVLLDENYHPKITDFGLSKYFKTNDSLTQSITNVGTSAYMAPETIKKNRFTVKSDVYAFGIIMYEVLSGTRAYHDISKKINAFQLQEKVSKEGFRPKIDDQKIPKYFKKMIEACWSNDPNERPTFQEIFNKLCLAENDDLIDFECNDYEPVLIDDDEEEEENNDNDNDNDNIHHYKKYCLKDVDEKELFLYIQEILEEVKVAEEPTSKNDDSEITKLKNKITELNNQIAQLKNQNNSNGNQQTSDGITGRLNALQGEINQMKILQIQKSNKPSQNKEGGSDDFKRQFSEIKKLVSQGILASVQIPNTPFMPNGLFANDKISSVTIPSTVLCISHNAFQNCAYLRNIELPSSIIYIQSGAFEGCTNLRRIKIPSSVVRIEFNAFKDCTALEAIEMPPTVTNIGFCAFLKCKSLKEFIFPTAATCIEDGTFYGCSSLLKLEIHDSIKSIGNRAFYGCESLKKIKIPTEVTILREGTFCGCNSLIEIDTPAALEQIDENVFNGCKSLKSIRIPQGITTIGQNFFCDCCSLNSIDLPSSVTEICQSAFSGCKLLKTIKLPKKLNKLNAGLFSQCTLLAKITIPSTVVSIGDSCFLNCTSLTEIKIPEGVTSIGNSAFSGCTSLTEINIPKGVTSIGQAAFSGCTSLLEIEIPPLAGKNLNRTFQGCSKLEKITIDQATIEPNRYIFSGCTAPKKLILKYSNKNRSYFIGNINEYFTNVVHLSILSEVEIEGIYISKQNLPNLESVEVSPTVKKLYSNWNENIYLKEIILCPSSTEVSHINTHEIIIKTNTSSLILNTDNYIRQAYKITIQSPIKTIEKNCFSYCNNLTELEIPSSVTTIGEFAFENCQKLKKINIPPSVTVLRQNTFKGCRCLTDVTLDPFSTQIENEAFDKDRYLNLTIKTKATTIDAENIKSFPNGRYFIFCENVKYFKKGAFSECTRLKEIHIQSPITEIESNTFYGCKALTNCEIPSTVKKIGDYAFKDCIALKEIKLHSIDSIGNNAFQGCSSLSSIELPPTIKKIGYYAFDKCPFTKIRIPSSASVGDDSIIYERYDP